MIDESDLGYPEHKDVMRLSKTHLHSLPVQQYLVMMIRPSLTLNSV